MPRPMAAGRIGRYSPYAALGGFLRVAYNNRNHPRVRQINQFGESARQQVLSAGQSAYNYFTDPVAMPSSRSTGRSRIRSSPSTVRSSAMPSRYSGGSGRKSRRMKRRKKLRRRKGRSSGGLMKKMFNKLCSPMTYKTTFAWAESGTANLRQLGWLEMGGASIVNTLGLNRPSNFLFDSVLGTANNAVLQDYSGQNWSMRINKYLYDSRIQNRSNASMELKIYECVIKHDAPSSQFPNGLANMDSIFASALDTPSFAGITQANIAPNQQGAPTGVSHYWQHPAFTPYLANNFKDYFRILKTHSHVIGPNEIVKKKFTQKPRTFKGQYITGGATEWLRGWSKVLLFSWVGQPNDDGTTAHQGKAKCDLFVEVDVTVKYHFQPGSQPLVTLNFTNDEDGVGQGYSFNPAGFTAAIPVDEVVQTATANTIPDLAP
nr:MAG: capsid protein [Cressdnaviricota sp.]